MATRNNPALGIMPQRMRRHAFLDPGGLGSGMDGTVELAGRERVNRIAAREKPAPRQQHAQAAALPPPGAQQPEQLRRPHGTAVLAAPAPPDRPQPAARGGGAGPPR